eukprot:m.22042 g.22042  ORF g.22042 m.22042 type:complete len:471 (-) comp13662_c0_seq1:73-1485(-)
MFSKSTSRSTSDLFLPKVDPTTEMAAVEANSVLAEEPQPVDPAQQPRNVNVHYQVSMLTFIDTSLMVWHAQVFVRGSWIVHRNKLDAMSQFTKSSDSGFERTEFERLNDWGKANKPSFTGNCVVKAEVKTQPVEDFLTIFSPQFYFVNLVGKRNESVQEYTCEIVKLGDDKILCLFAIRVLGDFATEMNLRKFPWDNTALELELMTQWDNTKMVLKDQQAVEPGRKNVFSETAIKYKPVEWEIYDHGLNTGGSEQGAKEFGYDKVFITVYVRRNAGFYLTKVFFPNYILCSSTVLSLFATTMGEQLGLILTVLLTGSAYQIVVSDAAPKGLPYNTNADWYLVMCMLWNAAILVICSTGVAPLNYTALWRLDSNELDEDYRFEHPEGLRNLVSILIGIWTLINVVWVGCSIKFSHTNIEKKWNYDVKKRTQSTSTLGRPSVGKRTDTAQSKKESKRKSKMGREKSTGSYEA